MQTSLTIPKDPVYPPSKDWVLLRREGIKHIERLGSAIWTDFNEHDPGITILEILCYAITDLGYRANLPAADLFSGIEGNPFFSATEILSCRPVTATDLRKILIDIPGVENAWVEQTDDPAVRFFFNNPLKSEELNSFLEKYAYTEPAINQLATISVNNEFLAGIFKCQSEKDKRVAIETFTGSVITSLWDLLQSDIFSEDQRRNLKRALLLYMTDRYRTETLNFLEEQIIAINVTGLSKDQKRTIYNKIKNLNALKEPDDHDLIEAAVDDLILLIDTNEKLRTFLFVEPLLCILFSDNLIFSAVPENTEAPSYYNLFIPQGVYKISLKLDADATVETNAIISKALKRVHSIRNLSEDFDPDIRIIEKIKTGIELNLQINPSMDKMEVVADVYRKIQNYLSLPVRFYSLEEMLNKYCIFVLDADIFELLEEAAVPAEIIEALKAFDKKELRGEDSFKLAMASILDKDSFEEYYGYLFVHSKKSYNADPVYRGPLLHHGFIDEDELIRSQPRQTIYKSDLYQLIAETEGVEQIHRLRIFKCEDREKMEDNWCLQFECRCLPELSPDCSSFSIHTGSINIGIPIDDLKDYLDAHPVSVTKLNRESSLDLPYPAKYVRPELTSYTSTQEDFPRTYKIGLTGIASKETDLRKAQTKQLKSYLLFYDQLLANYLMHMDSVQKLLSVKNISSNSFQPLYDIPGIRDLLLDFKPNDDWDKFIKDDKNPYITSLRNLVEGNETERNIRNNGILDHLLARFGEQFTDYVMALYQIEKPVLGSDIWEDNSGLGESIEDKQRLLDHLPVLGSQRSSAFNYYYDKSSNLQFWKTDNVPGLQKRVCAKLGIDDWTRHTITCEPAFVVEVAPVRNLGGSTSAKNKYEYYIKPDKESQTRLLVSTAKFSSANAAEKASADFLNMAVDKTNYGLVNENIIGFWYNIPDQNARTTANALLLEPRENPEKILDRLNMLIKMAAGNCQDDSFHLLEHLLLRPRSDAYSRMLRPMICCTDDLELLDPYSFWISVIIPGWTDRFKNPDQLRNFKQMVRSEAPAHLAIRFCILERDGLFEFEKVYYNWIKILFTSNQEGLPKATDELVAVMNGWGDSVIHYQ